MDVMVDADACIEFPTRFLLSLFHRVAQLGHLESLKLDLFTNRSTSYVDVGKALIAVVASCHMLKRLEISDDAKVLESYNMKDFFAILDAILNES